jgi:DNA-binding transcriptional ArsR family regulator
MFHVRNKTAWSRRRTGAPNRHGEFLAVRVRASNGSRRSLRFTAAPLARSPTHSRSRQVLRSTPSSNAPFCRSFRAFRIGTMPAMPRTTRAAQRTARPPQVTTGWTFLSNHAHVLIVLAAEPDSRMRDIAAHVGITERAVQRIVGELAEAGYVETLREGRRNRYRVHSDRSLRHPIEAHRQIRDLLRLGT